MTVENCTLGPVESHWNQIATNKVILACEEDIHYLTMALQRYTSSVDGTIPIQALLYTDEQLLASQEGVGIYDGYVSPNYLIQQPR